MDNATRILAVAATALAVAATTAHAQAASAPAQAMACGPGTAQPTCKDVPRVRSRLFDGIDLTKAQQDSIDAITRRYLALNNQLNAQRLPVDAHNAQVMALRARDIAEKRKVMTPAQLARFDANAAALKKRDEELIKESRKRAAARQKQGRGTATP
ncbi:MAG TPA: hypothetical protein VF041_19400 [Gemmatimonadaceae bacterium]